MRDELLRVYLDPDEIDLDGYPFAWRRSTPPVTLLHEPAALPPIKSLIREQAGYRCERCGHPYQPGITETCPRGEWTPCDEQCSHGGPYRYYSTLDGGIWYDGTGKSQAGDIAQWRILTTHHLNGVKHDCRWWNLAALCQRCHLVIQAKVHMQREYNREHTEWFKPHAAGFYAAYYLGEELTREETMARLDELLDLQLTQHPLPGFA